MAWDDSKTDSVDKVLAADWNSMVTDQKTRALTSNKPLNKLDGTTAPTTGDDSADGYSAGSQWVDVTNDVSYICQDATVGAAVWTEITGGGDVDGGTL